jgi:hypothetical protein
VSARPLCCEAFDPEALESELPLIPVPSVIAFHLALVAPAFGAPMPDGASTDDFQRERRLIIGEHQSLVLYAQAGAAESERRRRERESILAIRLEELNLKLNQVDTSWPATYRYMAIGGLALAIPGLIGGAALAGYGYATILIALGATFIAVGMVGVALIAVATLIAQPRTEAARNERNRILEEKMRAEAELQYLRGMTTGPR